MPDIPIGAKAERIVRVTNDNAISFLGNEKARVLATPWLVGYLEYVSRDLVKAYLLDGEDTVGTHVNVRHLAPTPMGMEARFVAEIKAVNGRRVSFSVEAFDDREKIAEGTHERAIIDVARFAGKVQSKRGQ